MKKAIIIIISLLVVLGGTFAILWFFTPVFDFLKPASDNFSVQVKKLFGAKEEVSYQDYIASIEKLKGKDESYTADAKVSMNIALPTKVLDSDTQKLLNSSSVEWKGSYDKDSKKISNDLKLSYNNKETFSLESVVDGKKVSVSSKDFYNKALTFDFDKFKSFCEQNNIQVTDEQMKAIEESLKSIDSESTAKASNFMYDLMYLTEEEYNALNKNYGDILTTLVDEDKYTTKKNQKVKVGGDEVNTTAYTLTLSGKDAYNYINKLAEMAKDDDNLKSILVNKINMMKNYIVSEAGSEVLTVQNEKKENDEKIEDIEKSDIEELLSSVIKELEESKEAFSSLKQVLKFTIYTDKKKNPVRFDVAIAKDEEDEGAVILSEEVEDGKNTYTIDLKELYNAVEDSSSSSSTADNMPKIIIVDEYEATDTSRKGKISVSAKAGGEKQNIIDIEYDKVNSNSEMKNNIKVSSELLKSLSLNLKIESTGLDKDKQDMVCSIDASIPVGYTTYKVKLDAEGSIEYGKSDIEKLDESNSVDVFSKSEEEITTIVKEIITNASNTLPSKLANYGVNITKEEILSLIPAEQTAPTVPATPTIPEAADPNAVQPAA